MVRGGGAGEPQQRELSIRQEGSSKAPVPLSPLAVWRNAGSLSPGPGRKELRRFPCSLSPHIGVAKTGQKGGAIDGGRAH